MTSYLAILVQLLVALGFVLLAITLSHSLGPKRDSENKLDAFECGIESKNNARLPFSIKYFLTAILFVLFDVEVIFFYPWATNFKDLGSSGFIEMLVFMATLFLGFLYLIKKKAFKWE